MIDWYFRPVSFIGIAMICLGTGGIKPCVVSFGADQFKVSKSNFGYRSILIGWRMGVIMEMTDAMCEQVPEQAKHMATYFAMFYASINIGSMISTIATPYLRSVAVLSQSVDVKFYCVFYILFITGK